MPDAGSRGGAIFTSPSARRIGAGRGSKYSPPVMPALPGHSRIAPHLFYVIISALMLGSLIAWYKGALAKGGYPLVALLMAVESSIVPLPSEVIIPPAAHLAWSGEGLEFLGVRFTG